MIPMLPSHWPSSLKMLLNPSRHPGHLMIPMCPSHRPSSLKMLLNPSRRHGLLMTMHLRLSLRPSHSMFPSMFFWPSILTRFTRNTASPSFTYWLATPLSLSPHVVEFTTASPHLVLKRLVIYLYFALCLKHCPARGPVKNIATKIATSRKSIIPWHSCCYRRIKSMIEL